MPGAENTTDHLRPREDGMQFLGKLGHSKKAIFTEKIQKVKFMSKQNAYSKKFREIQLSLWIDS